IPFALVGLALIVGIFYSMFLSIACRRSLVELDAHPLTPGQLVRIQVIQRGPLKLGHMRTLIVCEESATFEQGEVSKTDRKRIHEITIDASGDSWKCRGEFKIPADAMHSFEATHNAIQWKVLVLGTVARWFAVNWE